MSGTPGGRLVEVVLVVVVEAVVVVVEVVVLVVITHPPRELIGCAFGDQTKGTEKDNHT